MTIKTPQEIAAETMTAFTFIDHEDYDHDSPDADEGDVVEQSYGFIREQIEAAVEADRAQRDIYELIADALEDRHVGSGEYEPLRAAAVLRDGGGDDAWDNYIGPMLDRMEQAYGA